MSTCTAVVQRRLAVTAAAAAVSLTVGVSVAHDKVNRQRPLRPLQGHNNNNNNITTSLTSAMPSLKSDGVVIVRNILDEELLTKLRGTQVYQSMPTEMQRVRPHRRRGPPGAAAAAARKGSNIDDLYPPSASGRYHRREDTFSEADIEVFEELERKFLPLVFDFFDAEIDDGKDDEEGFFRSEMQIFNAVPGSKSQSWHSDNQSRGITVIIPLVDFTLDNGPTQLLVGSHHDQSQGGWLSYMSDILRNGAQVIEAPVGSIAAYDSRVFHRGLGNETSVGRPAIIFCYDRMSSPPPGIGNYASLRNSYWAGFLHIVSPASWK